MISHSLYEFKNVQRQRIFKQNRIILISSGLIEFWCFGLPVALGKGQVGMGVSGGIWGHGVSPHTHMHTHACTCTHAPLYIYRNCKWPPTWRQPCLACLTCMCVCVCMHACTCMCVHACMGHPLTHIHTHFHSYPPIHYPPRGDPRNQFKFDNT